MAAPNFKTLGSIVGKTSGFDVTTTLSTVLSNPANSGNVLKINTIFCSNIIGTQPADIDLCYNDGSGDFYIAKTISVPADATQILLSRDACIYIEEGDSIKAKASANNNLQLVIAFEEIS